MTMTATHWLAVSMVLFLAIALRPIVRAITGGLDGKRAELKAALDHATQLRAEAEALLADCQRQQSEAAAAAERMLEEARADAARLRQAAAAKTAEALKAREAQAMMKIAEAEANATREARNLAASLALEASRAVIMQRLSGESADKLVDAAIDELPQKLVS